MWTKLSDDTTIGDAITALKVNNVEAMVVDTHEEAKTKLLALLPKGAEVFTMTSITLETIGVLPDINESGNYISIRKQLLSMNRETQMREMRKLGASPDWAVGSVQAVTTGGQILMGSNTGSQLAAYVYGAGNVIWVVGTQKIVKDVNEGMRRIQEYCLPLESERLKKLRGVESSLRKVLISYKEVRPGRVTVIFVKERVGF